MRLTATSAQAVTNSSNSPVDSGVNHQSIEPPAPKKAHSPLGVISLFFGLVELGLAYSSGVSDGGVQIAVLVFMGLFAVGIAATFFVFLWYRNWVFYPPSEFGGVTVQAYVNAMRQDGLDITRIASDSVSRAFSDSTLLETLDLGHLPEDKHQAFVEGFYQEVRNRVIANVGASVIRIDPRPLKGEQSPQWEEPYDAQMPVERLLDRVWLRLQPFAPYPYGTTWILRDVATGKTFDNIGSASAGEWQGGTKDDRTAGEVGFKGGMTLEVVHKPI